MNTEGRRALLLGAGGMLARELAPALAAASYEVEAVSRADCDITDRDAVGRVIAGAKPALVVNCAAYTKVDLAETHEEEAFAVNAIGAGNVARAARDQSALVVHISTDYVFDGMKRTPYSEGDPEAPLGIYARSKFAGELEVRNAGGRWMIVRTGELYGHGGPNFFDAILKRARSGARLRVVSDQFVSPTWTRELAKQLALLVDRGPPGLYHATSSGAVSWYEAAQDALRIVGLATPIDPVSTEEYASPTPRPRYTVLAHAALEQLGIYCMRPWRDALAEWLEGG